MTTTLLLLNLPVSSFCALDLSSFTTTKRFRGIKNIPPGLHFCYFSPSVQNENAKISDIDALTSSGLSERSGFFFLASKETTFIVRKWDAQREQLVTGSEADLNTVKNNLDYVIREYLTPYENLQQPKEKEEVWMRLISALEDFDGSTITRILGTEWDCESSREASWETEELDSAIKSATQDQDVSTNLVPESSLNNDLQSVGHQSLGYTRIDLKRTWPENAIGRERTIYARDRSWKLEDTLEQIDSASSSGQFSKQATTSLLGELSLSYILTVLLANYSSTHQFKTLLDLLLTCNLALKTHAKFFTKFLHVVQSILEATSLLLGGTGQGASDDESDDEATGIIAEDALLEEFISGGDLFLIKLLRQFNRNLDDQDDTKETNDDIEDLKSTFDSLKKYCRKTLSWYLDDNYVKKGMVQLSAEEGGERVEVELEDDEGEEYKPVVVEL